MLNFRAAVLSFLITTVCSAAASAQNSQTQDKSTAEIPTIIGVVNGKALSLPVPAYPNAAKAVKANGAVNVKVLIDENGDVISAEATSGHPLLRASAVAAARQAKFTPTKLSGQPIKVFGVVVYNFVGNDVKMPLAALARNLTLVQNLAWTPQVKTNLESVVNAVPTEFANEREQILTLAKVNGTDKKQVLNKVLTSLERKMVESDAWQIKLGRALGEIEFQVRDQIADSSVKVNESELRTNLRKIADLIYSAPSDIAPESAAALKQLADYATQPSLTSSESLIGLMQTYTNFLKTVSPDRYK